MICVRVGLGGQRYWCSVSSISPASLSSFKYVVMLVAIVSVVSVVSCLYVFVSDKCCRPFAMYVDVSSTTMALPLSAGLMMREWFSLRALMVGG